MSTSHVSVDILKYKINDLCPSCFKHRIQEDHISTLGEKHRQLTKKLYRLYETQAFRIFGDISLPLCLICLQNSFDQCNRCAMPTIHSTDGCLAGDLLCQTTLCRESTLEVDDFICTHCETSERNETNKTNPTKSP